MKNMYTNALCNINIIYIYIYTHPGPCLMDHKIANGRFLPFSTKSRATNNGSSPIIEKYDKKKPQGSLSFFMRSVDSFPQITIVVYNIIIFRVLNPNIRRLHYYLQKSIVTAPYNNYYHCIMYTILLMYNVYML